MATKGKQKPQLQDEPIDLILDGVLIPLIFVALLLIKIGNFILLLLKIFPRFLKFPHFKLPTFPQITLSLPKISLPKTVIPGKPWPKVSPPKISLPKINLPGISLPRPSLRLRWFILGIFFSFLFIFIPYQAWVFLSSLPRPQLLSTREIPMTSKIFDRHGFLLYEIYAEQNRIPVTLSEIPNSLKEATIAIEDKEFYNHPGFSVRGILRAAKEIVLNHEIQGGSTITQQLVRSALLTPELSLNRKLKEIILSFWAERLYNKNQILEMYFNQVPYGGTAWGVEAASELYFGKKVSELDLAESAFLAGLPSAPSVYSPFGSHPEQGLSRQKDVLRKMVEQGFISPQQEFTADEEKLIFAAPKTEIKAPHFVMYVKDLLEKKYGPRLVQAGGLQVTTSLDLSLQETVQKIVSAEIEKLTPLNVGNGAALVTNPKTGEILAMVGSRDYFGSAEPKVASSDSDASFGQPFGGNFNVTTALRQPGSSIKVVNYALALEKGFTAATILDDSPITFRVAGQPSYTPVNYDGKFHGKIPLRQALANSYNVPAVKVLAQLGVNNMIAKGQAMGIGSWQDESRYGLSLTLGGGEVTMLDMARVYGTLANQGERKDLTAVLKVSDYSGKILEEFGEKPGTQAISPSVAFILSNILADNQARIPAFGANSLLNVPGKTVSVKTGTSNDLRDNWAIGFTPSFVVVTWVGNNSNAPMSWVASGVTGATPIWQQIMISLLSDKADEPILPPPDVIKLTVCGRSDFFIIGTEKNIACPLPSPSPQANL